MISNEWEKVQLCSIVRQVAVYAKVQLASCFSSRDTRNNGAPPRLVSWHAEQTDAIILNVDGSYKDSRTGFGGLDSWDMIRGW